MNRSNSNKAASAASVENQSTTTAENRLMDIKKAAKKLSKGVEESLRTGAKKELEARQMRSQEYKLSEQLASAASSLNQTKSSSDPEASQSPLHMVIDRYAKFEKNIANMLAENEQEMSNFLSQSPLIKLLDEDFPAVTAARKDLEALKRKQVTAQTAYDRESKKLTNLSFSAQVDKDLIRQQTEKTRRLLHEKETINKEVDFDQDKLCSKLLSLVSRENRYAASVLQLMKIKQQFYEVAFQTINAELPNLEGMLQETTMRPIFGEDLVDHLNACKRKIAKPLALSIMSLLDGGLTDEGLFRIPTKQIKLDKVKAFMDTNTPLTHVLQDCDAHFYAALLKCYLRELPVPLLSRQENYVYDRWIQVPLLRTKDTKIKEIRYILKILPEKVVVNIQYLVKFLAQLAKESSSNKMTPRNLGIVLGPSLLWKTGGNGLHNNPTAQTDNIESILKVVSLLIEYYHEIFPVDISWENFDEGISELINEVKLCKMTCSLQEDSKSLEAPQASHSSKRASTVMTSLRKTFSQMTPNFEESKHSHNSKETSVLETTTE